MLTACVIIPAHNEADYILGTLAGIFNQTHVPEMVVVTDDFSNDGTGNIIRKNYPKVTVLRPVRNLGSKAKAQNYALFAKRPDGEYVIQTNVVVTIDADTTLKNDALEIILREFDAHPDLMAACGTVIPANLDNPYALGRLGEYLFAFALPKRVQQALGGNIYIVSGCFGTYRTPQLRERGGWRGITMAEDMDLTADYHARDWKVAYVPEAVCYPVEPYDFKTYKNQLRRWSAAFFQNISLHWKDYASKPFGFFVFVSYIDAGAGGIEFLLLYPLMFHLTGLWYTLGLFVTWDLLGCAIPVLIMGRHLKMTRLAFASVPFVFYLRVLNIYFWFEALVNEWVLKKHLLVYIKGH